MLRVYVRCSTDDQDLASQEHDLERWLAVYGQGEQVIWYREEGVSGDAKVRPEYNRLIAEVRKGDTVLCWALDRISRGGIKPVADMLDFFNTADIRLVSVKEPWIDRNNPAIEPVLCVLAWAAQMEKKRIKERQKAGIAAAKAKGKRWGGRKAGTMQVRTPELDKTVKEMKASGKSVCSIARVCKISRPTVYAILQA